MTPSPPFLLVGLGNAGRQYRQNRHNVGFQLLDRLADSLRAGFSRVQFNALVADVRWHDSRIYLAKPQAMMNRSGQTVGPLARYYRIPMENLLVIYDDLDLPTGALRLRPAGGSGGHRGMESIIENLGTQAFPRLRVGIDRPPGRMDPADYVLQDFSDGELEVMQITLRQALECVERVLVEGIQSAMTHCNRSETDQA
ncbi:MAG: aminoacyl-tRNA hydrolase [Anaerolineales bacterium]